MNIHDKNGYKREALSFVWIKSEKGYNDIPTPLVTEDSAFYYSSYATLIADGDVLCDFYHVIEIPTLSNRLIVTDYDENSGRIQGTFEIAYIKDRVSDCNPTAVDTVVFKEGIFSTKIKE